MNYKKQILFVVVTVILGALGSGLWEYVFKSAFTSSTSVALNIATLGIDAFKDSLYTEVAKGFHESHSRNTQSFITSTIGVLYVVVALVGLTGFDRKKLRRRGLSDNALELMGSLDESELDKSEVKEKLQEIETLLEGKRKSTRKILKILSLLMLFVAVFLLSTGFREEYINAARAHFYQTLRIAAPHIKLQQEQEIEAQFSQVLNESDYRGVIERLDEIVEISGSKAPNFSIW